MTSTCNKFEFYIKVLKTTAFFGNLYGEPEMSLNPLLFPNKSTELCLYIHHGVKLFIELGSVLVKKDLMFIFTVTMKYRRNW